MHSYLRQSTAAQSRAIGPFLDDTDFKTAETGLTIANTDIKLVVNGGASADKNSGGGTHRANGVYGVTFDATDTATVGELFVSVKVAGALAVFATFVVVEEAVYDALYAASAVGPLLANSNGSGLTEAGGTGDHLTEIPWNAAWDAEVQSEVADALAVYDPPTNAEMEARTLVAASYGTATNQATIAGYIDTEVAAILATVDTEVAAIKAVTDLLPDAGALTSIATSVATVDTVVDAIKVQTDKLTFTVANQLDANVQSINDVAITGNGQVGTEFGV